MNEKTKEKILIIEDEADLVKGLKLNLADEGYEVDWAADGREGLRRALEEAPDIVILDLMLPGMNGLEVCRRLKQDPKLRPIPVVMLTAKGEEADIVAGLELGADDYLTKPFSPRVLVARIRAVLRRTVAKPIEGDSPIRVDDLVIHPGRHEVLAGREPIALTPMEFRVLHFLAGRPGWVCTRSQIIDAVHGGEAPVTDRSIDVQITSLRRKLGPAGKSIETVRGVGYKWKG